jgi:hypothetical protein
MSHQDGNLNVCPICCEPIKVHVLDHEMAALDSLFNVRVIWKRMIRYATPHLTLPS